MGGLFSRNRPESGTSTEQPESEEATAKPVEDLGNQPSTAEDIEQVEYNDVEDGIATGDLAVLYREGWEDPHFAIFVQHEDVDPDFPLLLVKGKSKPIPKEKINAHILREAHTTSAINRIFYGDYKTVLIRHLETNEKFPVEQVMENVEKVQKIPFTDSELEAIDKAKSDVARSALVSSLMVAHFYKLMPVSGAPVFEGDPSQVTPQTLQKHLKLSVAKSIKLPPVKLGPMATGEPPLLDRIVAGLRPPPEMKAVPFETVRDTFKTGDIILLSGATNSGAVIKLFDGSQFSHVGIVLKYHHTAQLMIFQSSTNRAGLVDVESGNVRRGVELLPLTFQIYSGWYERVAIRRLSEVDDTQRDEMYKSLLHFRKKVQGRPYEKSDLELIRSAMHFSESYLDFLQNDQEDLSSLFCSELVAEAYKNMGLLKTERLSNNFTPDDFSSARDSELQLEFGKLGPEVYLELKFETD